MSGAAAQQIAAADRPFESLIEAVLAFAGSLFVLVASLQSGCS